LSTINKDLKIKKNFIATFFKWLGLSVLAIFISCLTFLSIPRVQNLLFERLLKKLSAETHFNMQHKHFSLKWFHEGLLTDLKIKDPDNRLLCNISRLKLRINLFHFIWKQHLLIDYLELIQGQLHVVKDKEQSDFNLQILLGYLKTDSSDAKDSPASLKIKKAFFKDLSLLVDDQNVAPVAVGFDPYHIKIESVTAELAQISYERDGSFMGELQHFVGYYLTQELGIHKLHTQFKITPNGTFLNNLDIKTDASQLKGNFQLLYKRLEDLFNQPSEIEIVAQFDELKLASEELAQFIPYFQHHITKYNGKGRVVGKLSDFTIEDFFLEFGKNKSNLSGFARLQGLPDIENTHFNVELHKSRLYTTDLLPHFAKEHHSILQKLQCCTVESNLSGTTNHFIAKGYCQSDIGTLSTNMEVNIDKNAQEVIYKGDIKTQAFKIGKLLDIDDLREVTMHAYIDGRGITTETVNLYLKTHIQKLGFQKYNYANIRTDGRFAKAFFKGNVIVEDPNLVAHLDTKVNWRNAQKELVIKGLLSNISLDALGFTHKPTQLSSELSITLQGTSWDDLITDANFNRIQLDVENKPLYLDELHIVNGRNSGTSTLTLNSDMLDIEATGAIKYTALVHDIREFIHAYQQRLLTSKTFVPNYTKQPYLFKYRLHLKDINPLFSLLAPEVYVAPNTTLEGVFSQQEEVKFELQTNQINSLVIGKSRLQEGQLHFTALQNKNGELITASTKLLASKQQWNSDINTENFLLNINWVNDQISFKNNIGNEDSNLQLSLAGKITLAKQGFHIKFHDTAIRLADKTWDLHSANSISIHKSYIRLHNILLSNEAQQISLEGKWSPITSEKLIISLANVELNTLPFFLHKKMNGNVHGALIVMGTAGHPRIDSNIEIRAITVGDLMIGDLHTKAAWDNNAKSVNLACQLKHVQKPVIQLTGAYHITNKVQNLDLIAEFSQAQLAILAPFVSVVFSELKGEVDGRFHIKGPLKALQIEGNGMVKELSLRFSYLNALYKGEGILNCSGNKIEIEKLRLADEQQGQIDFQGNISHNYFKDFSLDLTGKGKKIKVLNTKYENNEYFYGKVVVTGDIAISGSFDNVTITADAITEKGTNFHIPIGKYNKKVEQESYIRFIDLKNCKKEIREDIRSIQLNGISLNMNLEVTPDAWAEIMLNGKNGDIIQSKGKGNLIIKSDSEGSLTMTGNYELVEGTYNFSVYDIVKRKFKILEGSTITWIENPYDGVLHVKAVYEQRTSLTPLLVGNTQVESNYMKNKKKYPVKVLLKLEGLLSAPDINFEFQFPQIPDNPDLEDAIRAFKEKAATDNNYLIKQVFSLVILKSFFADSRDNMNGDVNIWQKGLGELFSQQLSSYAAKLDENLEIDTDIDLKELNQEKTTSLPIKISYSLLSGRLIIARESKLDFAAGKEIDIANVVGDWSVEYGLTSDNRLKLRLHVYPSGSETNPYVSKPVFGGISFVYIKSFNRWRHIFTHNHPPSHPDKVTDKVSTK
jgi:hypothetical protein